jgi:transcriptional regulator with XRE-family HTH domain
MLLQTQSPKNSVVLQLNANGEIDLRLTFNRTLDYLIRAKRCPVCRVAKETGVSVSSISEYRNGKRELSTATYAKVLNYLIALPDAPVRQREKIEPYAYLL